MNAAHQIQLHYHRDKPGAPVHVATSCNCMRQPGGSYKPIVVLETEGEDPWQYYNDPRSHDHSVGAFRYEDQSGPPQAIYRKPDFEALLAELDSRGLAEESQ